LKVEVVIVEVAVVVSGNIFPARDSECAISLAMSCFVFRFVSPLVTRNVSFSPSKSKINDPGIDIIPYM